MLADTVWPCCFCSTQQRQRKQSAFTSRFLPCKRQPFQLLPSHTVTDFVQKFKSELVESLLPVWDTVGQTLKAFKGTWHVIWYKSMEVESGVEEDSEKRHVLRKLKRDPFALSYNKNVTPAVSDVCISSRVSVRRCCGCVDELFLAWGRDRLQGLQGKAISQSRLDRTFPGLLHFAGVCTDNMVPHSLCNKLFAPELGV